MQLAQYEVCKQLMGLISVQFKCAAPSSGISIWLFGNASVLHNEHVMKFDAHNPAREGARGGLNHQKPSFV